MSNFPFDIVGFDLDGTLVDTAADLAAAVDHILTQIGRAPLGVDAVRPMIGRGGGHMLHSALAASGGVPDDFDALLDRMIAWYTDHIAVHSRPFPGAVEMLDEFDAMGVKYAVVTNKRERLAHLLLGELGLSSRMAVILGGDTLGQDNAKPSPALILEMVKRCGGGRTAFVGDSIYDVMAARNANVPVVAVDFGIAYQPVEELGADGEIEHFDELVPMLWRLGG